MDNRKRIFSLCSQEIKPGGVCSPGNGPSIQPQKRQKNENVLNLFGAIPTQLVSPNIEQNAGEGQTLPLSSEPPSPEQYEWPEDLTQLEDSFSWLPQIDTLGISDSAHSFEQEEAENSNISQASPSQVLQVVNSNNKQVNWDYVEDNIDFPSLEIPFNVRYETTRLFQRISQREEVNDIVQSCIPSVLNGQSFDEVWKSMKKAYHDRTSKRLKAQDFCAFANKVQPGQWDNISLKARVTINTLKGAANSSRSVETRVRLAPLKLEDSSTKFWRKFGSDRFLVLNRPKYKDSIKVSKDTYYELLDKVIFKGFRLLGREWRPFYHTEVSDSEKDEGFSKTFRVMSFSAGQMSRETDIRSPSNELMTDGCGTASRAVLKQVARVKGLAYTPSWIQVRIGGVKGLLILDVTKKDDAWHREPRVIVRDSQRKFESTSREVQPHNWELEVVDFAKPLKATRLNQQLISILANNGVPNEAFTEIVRDHIHRSRVEELVQNMDDIDSIKSWLQDGKMRSCRQRFGDELSYSGSLPSIPEELVVSLLDAGFTPQNNSYLQTQLFKCLEERLEPLTKRSKYLVPKSTSVKCVPDFTGKLKEGEVFLRFSTTLNDASLGEGDALSGTVLLARCPAYTESDIQKVSACTDTDICAALKDLVDCIVLSTKGDKSLVSYLSGGDFDGDTLWVCWDERIVDPFISKGENLNLVDEYFLKPGPSNSVETILRRNNMDQDAAINEIVTAQLQNTLAYDPLGECSTLHQKVSYHQGLEDPLSKELAGLACRLLDAAKQGLVLKQEYWKKTRARARDLVSRKGEPLYLGKRADGAKSLDTWRKRIHILDYIRFDILETTILGLWESWHKQCGNVRTDIDIARVYEDELRRYEAIRTEILRHSKLSKSVTVIDLTSEKDMIVRDRGEATKASIHESSRTLVAREIIEELHVLKSEQLEALKNQWKRQWELSNSSSSFNENAQMDGVTVKNIFLEKYRNIRPQNKYGNPVIEDWASDADNPFSKWAQLKASALFLALCHYGNESQALVYAVAGEELCFIKARATGKRWRPILEASYLKMWTKLRKPLTQEGSFEEIEGGADSDIDADEEDWYGDGPPVEMEN
ncbi:hypothetical protein ABW19_dt0203098 [Dactylella cylindrospora]|nr:hypothetical protein ABW19_dt0203098 [Dactylella cylindrospora]